MMTVAARACATARRFVGIGLPSTAANLARRLARARPGADLRVGHHRHQARRAAALDRRRRCWPTTALSVVGVPEIFNYWLQPGRIDVGFLGAAQIDRFANINTTVIGEYDEPEVRLPGVRRRAGDRRLVPRGDRGHAPERRRSSSGSTSSPRGPRHRPDDRALLGLRGARPGAGDHRPRGARARPTRCELMLTAVHPACPSRRGGPRRGGSCGSRAPRRTSAAELARCALASRRLIPLVGRRRWRGGDAAARRHCS